MPAEPRYLPQRPLPRYAYVPGRQPHPVTDPRGHSFGLTPHEIAPLDPVHPERSCEFLYGLDLFNLGYYWEAHECWEELWHAAGRTGPMADFLKGLIKLAAAGVKAREGNSAGVQRHARRAAELLEQSATNPLTRVLLERLQQRELLPQCRRLEENPVTDTTPCDGGLAALGMKLNLLPGFPDRTG